MKKLVLASSMTSPWSVPVSPMRASSTSGVVSTVETEVCTLAGLARKRASWGTTPESACALPAGIWEKSTDQIAPVGVFVVTGPADGEPPDPPLLLPMIGTRSTFSCFVSAERLSGWEVPQPAAPALANAAAVRR